MLKIFAILLLMCISATAQITQLGLGFGGSTLEYFIDQNETVWC